jgi:hypothetical protein
MLIDSTSENLSSSKHNNTRSASAIVVEDVSVVIAKRVGQSDNEAGEKVACSSLNF